MRLKILLIAAGLLLGLMGWLILRTPGGSPPGGAAGVPTATALVHRGEVIQRIQLAGTLEYDGSFTVANQFASGIVTSIVPAGTVVERGGNLCTVSGTPVVLLYGATAAHRAFIPGMSNGPDVRQLEQNLVALGMDPSHAITLDDHFDSATRRAISRWQVARKLPAAERIGALRLGEVVFLPGELRVAENIATIGALVGPGEPLLSGTSTVQVVTIQVGTERQHLVHLHDQVQIALPSTSTRVTGEVIRIGRVAVTDPGQAPGSSQTATVPVTISAPLPAGTTGLDRSPVQVSVVTGRHSGVLMVPVVALLAKPGGGYQIRATAPQGLRLIDVRPGLYDDLTGMVEVSGDGLVPDLPVEVPST